MAEEHLITVKADTKQAEDNLDKVVDKLDEAKGEAKKAGKEIEDLGKSAKKGNKGMTSLTGGVKKMGTALKALGIGLVVAALAALAKLASENQVVMDKVSAAGKFLQLAFNDLVSFFTKDALPIFDRIKTFFSELTFDKIATAIKENLIERFESWLEVIGHVGTAIKKLFSGDFDGALDSYKAAGKEMVDVMTGVDNSVDKVVKNVKKIAKATGDYTEKLWDQGKAMVDLDKKAQIAEARREGIRLDYEREAEQLRQQRDNISLNIDARIEANRKLGEVLEKQVKLELDAAAIGVAQAEQNLKLNNTIDNQTALITAQNVVKAIQNDIEGKRSEQLVNEVGLLKEKEDLEKSADDRKKEKKKEDDEKKVDDDKKATDAAKIRADEIIAQEERILAAKFKTLDGIIQIAGAESAIGKAAIVAKSLLQLKEIAIDAGLIASKASKVVAESGLNAAKAGTDVAAGSAKATATLNPFIIASYAVSAALVIGSMVSALSKAKNTAAKYGGGGGGGSAPEAPKLSAAQFNIVESSAQNNQSSSLIDTTSQSQVIKAYVVGSEVQSQNELDRKKVDQASIG